MTSTITPTDNAVNTTYESITGTTLGADTGSEFAVAKIDGQYTVYSV